MSRFEPGTYELSAGGQTLVARLTDVEAKRVRDAAVVVVRPGGAGRGLTFRMLDGDAAVRHDPTHTQANATAASMLAALTAIGRS